MSSRLPTRHRAAMLVAAALPIAAAAEPASGARSDEPRAERVTLTVLATTDMHGYLYPYDYFTRQKAARGLAAAATLIAGVRRETSHVLLVDCGDTIQGSPLTAVYQASRRKGATSAPEPMTLAMSHVGYDAMVVGNHEFNFGLDAVAAARASSRFPWLSANTVAGGGQPAFAPYVVKTLAGVKVAVIGVTTPAVPQWEKPENIRGLSWLAPEQGVEQALRALAAEKPDVTIAAVHGGLGRPPEPGLARGNELPGENPAAAIAERFPQLAAVVYGHSHRREPELRVGTVLLVQPKNWAMDVARIELELERPAGGAWRLLRTASRLLPVTAETGPDPAVLALARPYHEAAEKELDLPVTHANAALSGARGHFEDNALVDAIHEVQRHYTGAPVSFASLLRDGVELPRGPVTRRELAGLYVYDNELYTLEGDGRMVRSALENAARCFLSCPEPGCERGPLRNPAVPGFNCDAAQGVEYQLDLRRPEGSRVTRLLYRGEPLRDDEPLRIAVNSYRAAGSAGYSMFRGARIAWRSGREIRELMAEYFGAPRPLPEKPDGNWMLLPARAVETLAAEAPAR